MCLSREETNSMRALAGTAEETVELSESLYRAVTTAAVETEAGTLEDDAMPTAETLRPPRVPVFSKG
jgi:hypothetical protein